MKRITYKGFIIVPLIHGYWEVSVGNESFKFDTLSQAKSRIDYWTK